MVDAIVEFLVHLFRNATGIELFWLGITSLGVFLMVGFFFEIQGDRRFNIENKINGARRLVAHAAIRRQTLKVIAAVCLAIPAWVTTFYETPVPDGLRSLNLICLSIVPVTLVLINLVDRAERAQLDDYYQNTDEVVADALQERKAASMDVQE